MGERLIQIILVLIILGIINYFIKLSRALKLEKRLANFAITYKKDEEPSLFDKVYEFIWHLVKCVSKILKKSQVFSKYSTKYNRYISYEEKDTKEGIDYITTKFLISICISLLSLITFAFQKVPMNFMISLLIFILTFFIPDIYWKIKFNYKRRKVEEDLLKAIIIMNNAFQSGRNIMQAIEIVKEEVDGPIQDEFRKIYLDITYGLSLDVVFNRFYERVKLEDAKYITSSLTLLNKTGGDIIKVFSLIEKSFLSKKNLKNELYSLTAASNFMFKLLISLPFFFILIIFILNPSYFKPLFTTPLGIMLLLFTILLYTLYILIIKRIMEVDY